MRFASFISGEFTTMSVINPPERKLEKPTSVQCVESQIFEKQARKGFRPISVSQIFLGSL